MRPQTWNRAISDHLQEYYSAHVASARKRAHIVALDIGSRYDGFHREAVDQTRSDP